MLAETLTLPGRASDRAPGKLRHVVFCFLPHVLFLMLTVGLVGRGWWLLAPALLLLVVWPLFDLLTGWQDDVQFQKEAFSAGELFLLRWNTRVYALLYMGTVCWMAMSIRRFTPLERGLLTADASLMAGICFAAAHELLHAKDKLDQILQRITTTFLFYPHYKLIHVRSHHVHVGTDHDENTAWLNESIYAYIARTIPGSMLRSWQLEARLAGIGSGTILRNKMYAYAAGQVVLLVLLCLFSGVAGLLFYLAQIAGAHVLLESVNYMQHYGLLREQHQGEYERTAAEHSWDTYHFFSSYATFRVGHHSYHHLEVEPYYLLGSEPQAPTLPVGYFWALAMMWLPPWWRRVIHPRIKA